MNNLANKTTFWSFLKQTEVRVPILQRDYAQGRKGKEALRENFLSSIKEALSGDSQLKLDFVYGSGDGEGHFLPLDGQQRLTTLWLLHWYFAYKTGELQKSEVQSVLDKFSYQTRESSKSFTHKLVTEGMKIEQISGENIADAILRQSWMFSLWRQDPTVQSMQRMLSGENNEKTDGIEEMFGSESKETLSLYWKKLMLDSMTCPIIFYQLDIENMGQSDDLYVKMNGRGKPLTDFENFKADFIKYIADQGWTSFLDAANGLPILLDTKWLDFFWQYRDDSNISLDDMMFGFINRFLLVRLMMMQIPQKIEDRDMDNSPIENAFKYLYSFTEKEDSRVSYNMTGFGVYQTVFDVLGGWSILYDLRIFLENIRTFARKDLTDCVAYPYEDGNEKFEVVYTSGKDDYYVQTIPETIAFWAVCQFFRSPTKCCTKDRLRQWMRIVWNVCNYRTLEKGGIDNEIRSKTALRSAILSLHKAFPYKWDAYNPAWFVVPEDKDKTSLHICEEQVKIKQFGLGQYKGTTSALLNKTWEEIIVSLEKLPIFKGTVRALFNNDKGDVDWSLFDTKYEHLYWYLNYSDKNVLGSIAYRNLLYHAYDTFHESYWYPKGDYRNASWRGKLPYYPESIHKWLKAPPLDENLLKTCVNTDSSYSKRSLIQTTLIHDVKDEKGMRAAFSDAMECDVYWHHQSSSSFIVFYEHRDKVILDAVSDGKIVLCNPDLLIKSCKLFNTKDIVFEYKGEIFNWHAKGVVYKNDRPDLAGQEPENISVLYGLLDSLLTTKKSLP